MRRCLPAIYGFCRTKKWRSSEFTTPIAPSPLSRVPQQQRASAVARGLEAPQSSPFVNPADTYNKARAADNYLWEVVSKLQGYRYQANEAVSGKVTVLSVTLPPSV